MAVRPYIDHYREHKIAPVTQDLTDMGRHIRRRSALYRQLGIVPAHLRGQRILEFGPGTGQNALYTNSLEPARYLLVDGNPTGCQITNKNLEKYFGQSKNWEVVCSLLEEFETEERFDAVFCEGMIPNQNDPAKFLRIAARFVAPGGTLVTTCVDAVSFLSETLRRLIVRLVVPPEASPIENLPLLRPFFATHLATLPDMSRLIDDWLLDSMQQPLMGKNFSIRDAIEAFHADPALSFDVQGGAPHFFTDWRWYKSIHTEDPACNDVAVQAYLANMHNLLDYRFLFDPRPPKENEKLFALCDRIWDMHLEATISADIKQVLLELEAHVQTFSPVTAAAIGEFAGAFPGMLASKQLPVLNQFAAFFGRGQQYLSFVRRSYPVLGG